MNLGEDPKENPENKGFEMKPSDN